MCPEKEKEKGRERSSSIVSIKSSPSPSPKKRSNSIVKKEKGSKDKDKERDTPDALQSASSTSTPAASSPSLPPPSVLLLLDPSLGTLPWEGLPLIERFFNGTPSPRRLKCALSHTSFQILMNTAPLPFPSLLFFLIYLAGKCTRDFSLHMYGHRLSRLQGTRL